MRRRGWGEHDEWRRGRRIRLHEIGFALLITRRSQVQILPPLPMSSQVIPEGTGPCQGLGDLSFGLSAVAAHTSR